VTFSRDTLIHPIFFPVRSLMELDQDSKIHVVESMDISPFETTALQMAYGAGKRFFPSQQPAFQKQKQRQKDPYPADTSREYVNTNILSPDTISRY